MQQINFLKMCPIPFRCFANISKGDSCTAMEDDINQVFDEQVEMLRMLTSQNDKLKLHTFLMAAHRAGMRTRIFENAQTGKRAVACMRRAHCELIEAQGVDWWDKLCSTPVAVEDLLAWTK